MELEKKNHREWSNLDPEGQYGIYSLKCECDVMWDILLHTANGWWIKLSQQMTRKNIAGQEIQTKTQREGTQSQEDAM